MSNKDTFHKFLALGDSYTIGESVAETERYPQLTVQLLNQSGYRFETPDIVAKTGWTTADLLNTLEQVHFSSLPYDIVTLLIGVNNQYQGNTLAAYERQFTVLLKKAIELAGNHRSHVYVLSIPDYSVSPFAKDRNVAQIAGDIDAFNALNQQIALAQQVHYIDITAESRKAASDPTLIASDGLHFSGKEYLVWAALLAAEIKRTLR